MAAGLAKAKSVTAEHVTAALAEGHVSPSSKANADTGDLLSASELGIS